MSRRFSPVVAAAALGGLSLFAGPGSARAAHDPCFQAIVNGAVNDPNHTFLLKTPALVVGVTNGCGVPDYYFFGSSEPAGGPAPQQPPAPLNKDTIFPVASVTKEFTSTLAMEYATGELANPGSIPIALDTTVNSYMPPQNAFGPLNPFFNVTLRNLIDMKSCLPDGVPRTDPAWPIPIGEQLFQAFDGTTPLAGCTIGVDGNYSNYGYALLGRMIEYATGIGYEEQILSNILQPLGMTHSNFYQGVNGLPLLTHDQLWSVPPGYNCTPSSAGSCSGTWTATWTPNGPGGLPHDDAWLGPGQNPSGMLFLSVQDLMTWLQAQIGLGQGGSLLPQGIGRAMESLRQDPKAWDTTFRPGWFAKDGALNYGYKSYVAYNPVARIGFFILANSAQFPETRLAPMLADALDSSTCVSQTFSPGMIGCPGKVGWSSDLTAQDALCPEGFSACTSDQWVAYGASSGQLPYHAYWTGDYLYSNPAQGGGACYASTFSGSSCAWGQPALICPLTSAPDNEGNTCTANNCSYQSPTTPDALFGGCLQSPTTPPKASTLCCRNASACAPNVQGQLIAPGVEGCKGKVSFEDRDKLCAPGCAACSASDWIQYRGGTVPVAHYWTRDNLLYNGSANACWVSTTTGTACAGNSPMRVCAPTQTDPYGNFCKWTNCGDDQTGGVTPNDYFGGCSGANSTTAGTLCCCNQ